MEDRRAGLVVLGGTYSIVIVSLLSFYYVKDNDTLNYYWCWVFLCPVMFWLWALIAWCEAEMLSNAKRI
ncbi:hypothetical protein Kpol_1074p2 [Vanderwaltozyma polyspora DSM 70294]|uniref:Uncharacterized protein n=1 Tax=Vanderwaltozyma polyspora (strain ATCC 22028 / DSM 70294 / BCRC 21397 / CBS 2163 / NBRC 10782 / NRRL Y-8283 / UCD 57-17) TaxID=436907 RepID=A7TTQ6_VANPO|nr:uncharacterized protein Kpol_1074p2 [Vanderwaltozyma polyspora DSM 70294]EDO14349.1 hypothetical protein Kpol_1074p2 [Vanderwaltozyma polyspora DSM 70294]